MGMFDNVICNYPLPDSRFQCDWFQTKDLGSLMDTYTITKEGCLLKHIYGAEDVPEDEWVDHDAKWGRIFDTEVYAEFVRKYGRKRGVLEHLEVVPYHGVIYICTVGKTGPWQLYEYEVCFVRGRVESVTRASRWPNSHEEEV